MSKVDVIIPCYKYAHYLSACVESVLSQCGVEVRVLILDDASPDNTPEVCTELALMDARVSYLRHEKNMGHIATYNEGLEWAQSDYTLLLSADDLIIDGALAHATQLMDNNPDVALCYGKEIYFTTDNPLPEVPLIFENEYSKVMSSQDFLKLACDSGENFIPTAAAVVRTKIQKNIGGYRKELPHSGDLEMWLRFGANASVGVINRYQAYSRVHSNNMRLQYPGVKDYLQLKAAFDSAFQEYGHKIADLENLKSTAYMNIAKRAFWDATKMYDNETNINCNDLLSFSQEIWPEITKSKSWLKFKLKLNFKPVWPIIRPILDKLRNISC